MPEKERDLLQVASGLLAELRTGPLRVRRGNGVQDHFAEFGLRRGQRRHFQRGTGILTIPHRDYLRLSNGTLTGHTGFQFSTICG